jgi:hypothetical protein
MSLGLHLDELGSDGRAHGNTPHSNLYEPLVRQGSPSHEPDWCPGSNQFSRGAWDTRVAAAGGKRLRPALTYACAALGTPEWGRVLNAAVAVRAEAGLLRPHGLKSATLVAPLGSRYLDSALFGARD